MRHLSFGGRVRRISLLAILAVASGCTTIEETTGIDMGVGYPKEGTVLDNYQPSGINYAALIKERAETLKEERAGGRGLVHAPELSKYLNDVLQKILNVAPEKNIPAKVYITDSEQFGAAARQDGSIFVPIGLLRNVKSEDALAFVLAHELSHVIYQDQESETWVNVQDHIVSTMGLLRDTTREKKDQDSQQASSALALYAMMGEVLLILSDELLNPVWTREQEDQADLMGLDLMIKAGYKPGEVAELFTDLEAAEAQLEARGGKPRQRLARVMAEFLGQDSWESHISDGIVYVSGGIQDVFGTDHRPSADRITWLNGYIDTAHVDNDGLDFVERRPIPWTDEGRAVAGTMFRGYETKTMSQLLENYENAYAAESALDTEKLAEAESLAKKGVSWPTASATHPRLVFYSVRSKQGKSGLAKQNLEIAIADKEPSLAPYQKLVNAYIAEGNFQRALYYADKAGKDLGEPPQLMPTRIMLNVKQGRRKEAEKVYSRCQVLYPKMGEDCRDALDGHADEPQTVQSSETTDQPEAQQQKELLPSLLDVFTESNSAAE